MRLTFTPHISRRDSLILLILMAAGLALASAMLVYSASEVQRNPGHGVVIGGAIAALAFALIAIWQRMRMSYLGKRVLRLTRRAQELARVSLRNADSSGQELLAEDIAFADMKDMGMDPVQDEGGVLFRFQGGYFRMMDTSERMVRIYYPCIYSAPAEAQNLVTRQVNRVNGSCSLVKLYVSASVDDDGVSVHAFADVLYTSGIPYRKDMLRQLLQIFFNAQHSLAIGMAAATKGDEEEMQNQFVCDAGAAALN